MELPLALPIDLSIAAQVECIEREIRQRERLYPRWVQERRMTAEKAAREIAAMRAVLATLRRLAAMAAAG